MTRALVGAALLLAGAVHTASAQDAVQLELVRDLMVGRSPDGMERSASGFTTIFRVSVGPSGDIFVGRHFDNWVRQFDSAGRYLRDIGRRGSGPGENTSLRGSGLFGDTLWQFNFVPPRASLFTLDGRLIESFSPPDIRVGGTTLRVSELLPDGATIHRPLLSGPPTPERIAPVVIGTRIGRIVDTVGRVLVYPRGHFGLDPIS